MTNQTRALFNAVMDKYPKKSIGQIIHCICDMTDDDKVDALDTLCAPDDSALEYALNGMLVGADLPNWFENKR